MSFLEEHLDELLEQLRCTADLDQKSALQQRIYSAAAESLANGGSLRQIHALAPRFEESGLFLGSDWDRPELLQPGLVEGSLTDRVGIGIECCSQLRFLTIAEGRLVHEKVTADAARSFLEQVLALNLAGLVPVEIYERDAQPEALRPLVRRLFEYIVDALGADGILLRLVTSAKRVLLTRPIKVEPVRRMIETAGRGLDLCSDSNLRREALFLVDALGGPTPLSRQLPEAEAYADALSKLDDAALLLEADTMANSMRRSGLVSPQHAVLVRVANERDFRLLARSLGIEDVGRCCLETFPVLARNLIERAIHPATAQAVYGLAQLLDRGVLFQPSVVRGLNAIESAEILPEVAENLVAGIQRGEPPEPGSILLAGALEVLGLPRGVDQGHNPTCQSARAISLWAQNDPGFLLKLILHAARDGNVCMYFEGTPISSREVERGVADELHAELDSVSLLLTPHIDRIYWKMSHLALDRPEDEHKWVNPELHGWWVHRGFAAVLEEETQTIVNADVFLRQFFASYHPTFGGEQALMTPQPAGVAITNSEGVFLDWHAVSLQRVGLDPHGVTRVYFFNPNHDKGQDWGQGIFTSTSDHGELMGESSLPFEQFASRLYVFHYDESESGDSRDVPVEAVQGALELLTESWGRTFAPPHPDTGETP